MPPRDGSAFQPSVGPYGVTLDHGLGWPYPRVRELGEDVRAEIIGWLNLKVVTGQYSQVLVTDLLTHLRNDTLDLHDVYDAIGALEGAAHTRPSATKPESQFRRPPLKGFWHKHHHHGSMISLVKNIHNHWAKGGVADLVARHLEGEPVVTSQLTSRLAHEYVITGYQDRASARELTGEWILFAKHGGINYYLTLGKHGESDDAIAHRVRQCEAEFPGVRLLEP